MERLALAGAQAGAGTALVGAFALPTLANAGALVMLLSMAVLPSARQRLGQVLALPLARAAVALLFVIGVAALWSDVAPLIRLRSWWDWRPLILLLIGLAIFDQPQPRRRVLLAFIAAASMGAAYSFWAWAHGFSTVANNHSMTGIVLRNPVTQGMAFATAAFIALMLALARQPLDRRLRLALGVASLWLVTNLVFVTSSRSAHLLLLIMLGATALQLLRGWRRAGAIAALPLLAAVAIGVSPMLQTRFGLMVQELRQPLASEHLSAMGIRSVIWNVSLKMAGERPLLGYGTGGFAPAYARALAKTSYQGWAATPSEDPHNQYLQVQLQAGIAGTIAFAWFLVAGFRQPAAQPYRAWASALLLGWCATSLASSHFTTFAEGHLLMLMLGLLLAPAREPADSGGDTLPAARPRA